MDRPLADLTKKIVPALDELAPFSEKGEHAVRFLVSKNFVVTRIYPENMAPIAFVRMGANFGEFVRLAELPRPAALIVHAHGDSDGTTRFTFFRDGVAYTCDVL